MRNRLILWIALLASCVSLYGATPIMLVNESDTAYYETFPDALKEANKLPSARLTLLDDVSFEGKAAVQTIKTNLSIDLNGYTLGDSLSSDRLFNLAIDSLTLRIFSSRPNGRIRMAAQRNGSIYAVYCTKGRLEIEDITIEGSNTAEDAAAFPNAGARGVYVGAYSMLAMNHCDISMESHGVANALFAAGDAKSAGRINVRNSTLKVRAVKGSSAVYCFASLTMDSCELDVQTELNAYGINMQAYNKDLHWNDTARVTNTRMTAVSSTKGAYGIQSKGHLYLANDSLSAKTTYENCYALYMSQDSMSCSAVNCSFNAEAGTVTSYAAYVLKGAFDAEDCFFSGICRQDTLHTPSETSARAVAGSNNTIVNVRRSTLIARGTNTALAKNVICASVNSTTRLTLHDCDLITKGGDGTRGIRALGDTKSACIADIRRCRIIAHGEKNSYGISCYGTSFIEDCSIDVVASAGTYAYGIQVNNFKDTTTLQDAEATINHVTIQGQAVNRFYGIYTKAPLVLSRNTIVGKTERDYGMGFYTQNDSAHFLLDNCSFHVETGYVHAYGAYIYRGHLTASDCSFSATGRQDTVQNQIMETYVRGLTSGDNSTLSLNRCTLLARGTNKKAARSVWCLYVNRSTQADIVNCTITAEGMEGASGIYAAGDASSKSHIRIRGSEINSRAKTKVYGIQLYCKGQIANCKMNVQADASAYGVYATNTCDTVDIRGCYLKVKASKDYGPVNRLSSLVGRLTIQSGFYTDDTNLKMYLPSDTCGVYRLRSGVEFNQGYRYTIRDAENPGLSVAAVYEAEKVSLIGRFNSLTDALTYISYDPSKTYTIVLTSDLRLGPATYRIPANATLVVPYMEDQKEAMGIRPRRAAAVSYLKPYEYVRLTLKEGAHLLVEGALEVSGVQKTTYEYQGCVSSDYGYGRIHMLPGSSITLADSARLHAWGYITGPGTITAQAGSAVYELLQIGEWKGGTVIYQMINNPKRVFPLTHFFYQNIESPITYLAGAKAYGSAYVSVQGASLACDNIRLISDQDALFIMRDSTNASVSKVYDPLTDRVTWATNGNASLSELGIILKMGTMDFSLYSSHYILPVCTYMTIRAESGTLTVEHDVSLLPGAQVEVAPGAQAIIPQNTKFYVYDIDDWGTWAGKKQSTINYSPSWTTCPRDTMQPSARMIIGGELTVEGSLYTTEHNAEILGTDEADGQIIFVNQPQRQDSIYQVTGEGFDFVYTGAALNPAMLMNADSTFVATQGIKAGALFTYQDGQWTYPPGSFEGIENTSSSTPSGRLILQNGQLFVLLPDGQRFSLLGQKW